MSNHRRLCFSSFYTTSNHLFYNTFSQIGHEPIPPRPTTTIFGQPALALPNIFQYGLYRFLALRFSPYALLSVSNRFLNIFFRTVKYIKTVDGFTGCYRGLVPKLCANAVSAFAFQKTNENIVFANDPDKQVDEDDLSEQQRFHCCRNYLL